MRKILKMSSNQEKQEDKETDRPSRKTTTPNNDDSKSAEPASYNPNLTENECQNEDLERLKGDAIGDTLYSERFVLNTLLKMGQLSKDLQEEDEVERDLCSLWDMTLEEDVVKYLLKHDVLELFASIIKATEDKRLTEILVGIIGNMCNVKETREQLAGKEEVVHILLDLTACVDSLTLEQLMRLIAVIFVKMKEDQVEKWYNFILNSDKFIENLCYILNNAANNSLILQTLESLNAILAKFFVLKLSMATENGKTIEEDINKPNFEKLFVQSQVVEGTIEAFKSLVKECKSKQDSYEASEIPESTYKAKQTFCNIHSILTQYQELSKEAYKSSNEEILKCFKDILQPIAQNDAISTWQQYEQDVLETLNDVLRVLHQPLDLDISKYLLKLLYVVNKELEKQVKKSAATNDFESEDDTEIDHQISHSIILNTLYYLILKADKEMLKQCVSSCPRKYTTNLLENFEQPLETEYLQTCYQKLKEVLDE